MNQNPLSQSAIFRGAVRLTPDRRPAFLDAACQGDRPLRSDVESLLRAHDLEGSFLSSPAVQLTTEKPLAERPGTMIGPYKLREQIGEGGFGVVYVAEQEKPVRRKVALKVIKPGMDSKDVIARFEAERQALALMDHPNVARVLDAGTTESGRPYFVMELVHGVPITEFCDKNKLPTRDRLLLFSDVCRAVQHAHQKGIIHRDLKPSNIMVTLHDGKPVAKVIDFGVSKALSQQLTEKSIYTAYGQMIGTPSYMSPEQAEMSGLGIDTRSDIYSLGVLLYELLTGKTPLDARRLRASAYAEILRIIKEEEPPRPSLKVSTLGEEATVIAQHRHTDPAQLRRDLSGELDWIVMKCLEKDRARRYETANGLARDIERYLADEPVEACPPSLAYRFRKLARKHRGLLTTAASIIGVLVAAVIISTSLAAWAKRAQHQAQAALLNERLARQEAVAAKERADQAARRLRQATEIASEGLAYYNRSNWSAAHERFTKAARIEPNLDTPYFYRGALYINLGLWDRAAADYERRFALASRADAQTCYENALLRFYVGDEAGYRKACADLLRQHGSSGENSTRFNVLRACLVAPEPAGDPADLVGRTEALVASGYAPWHLGLAGMAHLRAGNLQEAVNRFRETIKVGAGGPNGIQRYNYAPLATALYRQDKPTEAKEALARAEQARDEWIKAMEDGLVGTVPIRWWDWLQFNLLYREAKMLISGAVLDEDPRLVAISQRSLATITHGDLFTLMDAGREHISRQAWNEAAASFARVLDKLPVGFRAHSQEMRFCIEMVQQPDVFQRLVELRPRERRLWFARGRVFASGREWTKATADYEKSLELIKQQVLEADAANKIGPLTGQAATTFELAELRLLAGDDASYRELCARIVSQPLETDNDIVQFARSRACTLRPDSVTDWSVPLRLAQSAVTKQPRIAWYVFGLGMAQHRAGDDEAAIQTFMRSLAVQPTWVGRGQNYVGLALACHRLGRHEEARQWLDKTKSWLNERNREMATFKFGYAASDYMNDWLAVLVLLPEAERLPGENRGSQSN